MPPRDQLLEGPLFLSRGIFLSCLLSALLWAALILAGREIWVLLR